MSESDPSPTPAMHTPSPAASPSATTGYRPHSRYLLYLLITLGASAYLAWMLLRAFDTVTAFIFALCLACAIWSAWNLFSVVTVDAKGIRVESPLGRAACVDFRQFAEVAPGGRFLPTIVVIYHPLRGDGQLDLDEFRSLHLPAVEERDTLLEYLQQQTPS
jgi:hypothetical protein